MIKPGICKGRSKIENRYHEHLTVDSPAAYCNINRSYLCRLFKGAYGIGPKEYLLNFRMNIAVSLLKNSATAIKVVGISVGYENQLHFSKAFRKLYGVSPAKWRQNTFLNSRRRLDVRLIFNSALRLS